MMINLTFYMQKFVSLESSYCRSVNQSNRKIMSKCVTLFEMLSLYELNLYIY